MFKCYAVVEHRLSDCAVATDSGRPAPRFFAILDTLKGVRDVIDVPIYKTRSNPTRS